MKPPSRCAVARYLGCLVESSASRRVRSITAGDDSGRSRAVLHGGQSVDDDTDSLYGNLCSRNPAVMDRIGRERGVFWGTVLIAVVLRTCFETDIRSSTHSLRQSITSFTSSSASPGSRSPSSSSTDSAWSISRWASVNTRLPLISDVSWQPRHFGSGVDLSKHTDGCREPPRFVRVEGTEIGAPA